jgi:hypothetical protein
MIRIRLGAKAREGEYTPSLPVAGNGLQGCAAGLSISDEGRLRINNWARLEAHT